MTHELDRAALDALLTAQLDGRDRGDFDAGALARKATHRAERKAPLAAAVLFEAAAEVARAAAERSRWLESRVRAGTHFVEAGQLGRGLPILREMIAAHRAVPGHRDAHMVEWCFALLLRHAEDAAAFRTLFGEAAAVCDEVGCRGFPTIHAHQEELFERAHALGCVVEECQLAAILAQRRPLPRALRARLTELGHETPAPRARSRT